MENKETIEQKRENPYWLKINKLQAEITKLERRIEILEKCLKR